MSKTIEGANAISSYIESHFLEQETLIRLRYGEAVVAQFMTVIDDTETEHLNMDHFTDDKVETMTDQEWDRYAGSLTIYGEVIEAVESEGDIFSTETTFFIDDPAAFTAEIDEHGDAYISAGGEWSMWLIRLREPLRRKTHEVVEKARDRMRKQDDREG